MENTTLETIDPRTRRAAAMLANGATDTEVCKALKLHAGTLKVWKGSQLFGELLAVYKEQLAERGAEAVLDELSDDARRNIRFIKAVRDGDFDDSKDRMDLKLRAAFKLLDKSVPDANQRAAIDNAAGVLRIDGRMLSQVLRAMKNSGVIDVTAEEIEDATGSATPRIPFLTPDEARPTKPPIDPEEI